MLCGVSVSLTSPARQTSQVSPPPPRPRTWRSLEQKEEVCARRAPGWPLAPSPWHREAPSPGVGEGHPQTLRARNPFRSWRKAEAMQKAVSRPPPPDLATTSQQPTAVPLARTFTRPPPRVGIPLPSPTTPGHTPRRHSGPRAGQWALRLRRRGAGPTWPAEGVGRGGAALPRPWRVSVGWGLRPASVMGARLPPRAAVGRVGGSSASGAPPGGFGVGEGREDYWIGWCWVCELWGLASVGKMGSKGRFVVILLKKEMLWKRGLQIFIALGNYVSLPLCQVRRLASCLCQTREWLTITWGYEKQGIPV